MHKQSERILVVDMIRGFALMGLFLIHVLEYYELYWVDPQPGPIRTVVTFLFSGKAYSTFALMFGLSFYMLLEGRGPDRNFTPGRFAWRMVLLIMFGYIHSLMYPGDILQQLAVCGFFLLAVYRVPTRYLVLLAVLFLGQLAAALQFAIAFQDESYTQPLFWALSGMNFQAYMQGDFFAFIEYTAWKGQLAKWVLVPETGSLWHLFGLFILGLLIGRSRFFEKDWPARRLGKYLAVAVVVYIVVEIVRRNFTGYFPEFMPRWGFDVITYNYMIVAMIAVYVLGFMLLIRLPPARRLLTPFAACGRMTLTLYIAQSFVVVPIYYGFGLGLYDTIGQRNALLLGLGLWIGQMLFAGLWFRYFHYGPLEWLWRSLTQLRFDIPIRRRTEPGRVAAAVADPDS